MLLIARFANAQAFRRVDTVLTNDWRELGANVAQDHNAANLRRVGVAGYSLAFDLIIFDEFALVRIFSSWRINFK
jgi:hypothetical protein